MDEERQFNEHMLPVVVGGDSIQSPAMPSRRPRTLSSPLPPMGRPVTPSLGLPPPQPQLTPITSNHCPTCLMILPTFACSTPSSTVGTPNALPTQSQAHGSSIGDHHPQQHQNNVTR